ncbi:Mbeg1-like protein [Chitinophaga sp. Hz27]|uniref:lipase family protein n=1 Tax=Chitinophaga sp. Hz27 TaxID=3347169 RepID=UPI0035D8BF9C
MDTVSNAVAPGRRVFALQLCFVCGKNEPANYLKTLMPDWEMVWSHGAGELTDPNYFFIAKYNKYTDVEALYALVIRGSVPPADDLADLVDYFLEDLNIVPVDWAHGPSGAKISAGAEIGFQPLKLEKNTLPGSKSQTALEYLKENAVGNRKRLLIAGHSLGGDLAKVYASYYMQELKGGPIAAVDLVTFAAPGSGNDIFQNDLNSKVPSQEHFQNSSDIVPYFPTANMSSVGALYNPSPSAAVVRTKDDKMTLKEFFEGLGTTLKPLGYQQPFTGFLTIKGAAPIGKPDQLTNTLPNWNLQAGTQHQIPVYSVLFDLPLPTGQQVMAEEAAV